ncbi:MAG: metallophosphoesterase [Candidatus Rifleibacteriota bacterium]
MFSLILNVIGSILHFYSAHRIGTMSAVKGKVGVRNWWLAVIFVWIFYIVGVQIGDEPIGPVTWLLAQFSFYWLMSLFLLALCLFVVDLVTGFGFWLQKRIQILRFVAILVGIGLAVTAIVQGVRAPVVTPHELVMENLPPELDGMKIVAISDMHLGVAIGREWLEARIKQVSKLQPDLIVIVGDLIEGDVHLIPGLKETMSQLKASSGVWAVTGNHEFHGDVAATLKLFESAGVQWLRDRSVEIQPGLWLAGVDYRRGRGKKSDLKPELLKKLAGPDKSVSLLLSHAPTNVEGAADAGFDLMISGHTHGGQVWPFGYLLRLRYSYFIGHYRVKNMHFLIGRGTGAWGARMRLWQPGEILYITLRSKSYKH